MKMIETKLGSFTTYAGLLVASRQLSHRSMQASVRSCLGSRKLQTLSSPEKDFVGDKGLLNTCSHLNVTRQNADKELKVSLKISGHFVVKLTDKMFNSSPTMMCLQSNIPSASGFRKASNHHHVAAASQFCPSVTHPSRALLNLRNCRHLSVRNYHALKVSTSLSLLALIFHNYLTRCRFHMLVSCSTLFSQTSSTLGKNFMSVSNGTLDKVLGKSFSEGELTDKVYGQHLPKGDHYGNLETISKESSSGKRDSNADMRHDINYETTKEMTQFKHTFSDNNDGSHDIYAQLYFNLMNEENVKLQNVSLCKPEDNYVHMYSRLAKADGTDRRETEIRLTHTDTDGKAMMVDVGDKTTTLREARAEGRIILGPEAARLVKENKIKKGDVLTVAQIAGITAAKQTAQLIPLCHNINLTKVNVTCVLNEECDSVDITSLVRTLGVTGVEMEALMAVSVAALTVYDMCKAVTHDMVISDVRLVSKSGGKRHFQR